MRSSLAPFSLYAIALGVSGAYTFNNPVCWAATLKHYEEHTVLFAAVGIVLLIIGYALLPAIIDEGRVGGVSGVLNHKNSYLDRPNIESVVSEFYDFYGNDTREGGADHEAKLADRQREYTTLVNHFYNMVTDFYEYGWGDCFHFGFRFKGESFDESIRRTEYYLALRLGLNENTHAADVGCGVGGPMRNIARFSGSKITGINNNQYQIDIGTRYNKKLHLDKQCDFVKCDFQHMVVPDNTFTHAYAIEATCHAGNKVECFREVLRVVKPGGLFAGYEWCTLPKYDASNPVHRSIKEGIEQGNSLPTLATPEQVVAALTEAGWEVIEAFDGHRGMHTETETPWYQSLDGSYTLRGFRMTRLGRILTHCLVSTLEFLRIAPKGATRVSALLNNTAIDLVNGGKLEIFSPDYFFLARKPLDGAAPVASNTSSTTASRSSGRAYAYEEASDNEPEEQPKSRRRASIKH